VYPFRLNLLKDIKNRTGFLCVASHKADEVEWLILEQEWKMRRFQT
jgi:hypothetical protein